MTSQLHVVIPDADSRCTLVLSPKPKIADRGGARRLTGLEPTRLKAGMGGQLAVRSHRNPPVALHTVICSRASQACCPAVCRPQRAAAAALPFCTIAKRAGSREVHPNQQTHLKPVQPGSQLNLRPAPSNARCWSGCGPLPALLQAKADIAPTSSLSCLAAPCRC